MIRKILKTAILTLLCFLLQTTVAPHIALKNVAPNIALAILAVISVTKGKKYTFFMSLMVGYLIEISVPALQFLNLVLYPVAAMIGALLFADKSERKLEAERTAGNYNYQMNPHIRIPFCALVSCLIYEAVLLIYIFLNGVAANPGNISRAVMDVIYTTVLATAIQFPIRWYLGVYRNK